MVSMIVRRVLYGDAKLNRDLTDRLSCYSVPFY
jgi:hypothetical protein